VRLPLPETPKKTVKVAISEVFKKKLLLEWNTFAPVFYHNNGWWIRCSAQVWNDVGAFFMVGGGRNCMKRALR